MIRISKRDGIRPLSSLLIRVIALLIAMLACVLLSFASTGRSPFVVLQQMVAGSFGTPKRMWEFLQRTMMLTCIAVGLAPAFKMRFWNVGAEGQLLIGGLGAVILMRFCYKLPSIPLLILMALLAIAFGAIWGMIPGFFKAKWNANETLFTLMMNYIATQIVAYFCYVWSVPKGSGQIGIINSKTMAGWLPQIGGQRYLLNILIVLALTVFMFVYLKYSKHGYELTVVGESENTARYIGINVPKVILRTMLLSGAICGIAGMLLVSGTDHTITRNTVAGRGFTAIMVSWLAKFNPLMMIITSFLIVFLQKGASEITTKLGLNNSFSEILTGIIIFFIIGSEFFINYALKFRGHKEATK